jgi:hypothetical protein
MSQGVIDIEGNGDTPKDARRWIDHESQPMSEIILPGELHGIVDRRPKFQALPSSRRMMAK